MGYVWDSNSHALDVPGEGRVVAAFNTGGVDVKQPDAAVRGGWSPTTPHTYYQGDTVEALG
jgi:hypothetical protein